MFVFGKFNVLCFLETPVLRFALLPYYQQNEGSLKMIKNAFYFILKALFVLEIFKLLCWLFAHVEKTASLER